MATPSTVVGPADAGGLPKVGLLGWNSGRGVHGCLVAVVNCRGLGSGWGRSCVSRPSPVRTGSHQSGPGRADCVPAGCRSNWNANELVQRGRVWCRRFQFSRNGTARVTGSGVGEGSSGSSVEFFELSLHVEVGWFHRCGRRRREWWEGFAVDSPGAVALSGHVG